MHPDCSSMVPSCANGALDLACSGSGSSDAATTCQAYDPGSHRNDGAAAIAMVAAARAGGIEGGIPNGYNPLWAVEEGATEGAADAGALELPRPEDVGVEGTSPNIRVETGGRDAAQDFFSRYAEGGVDVTPTGYGGTAGGQLVRLPDGSYVGIRYVSSYGDPVVDLNGADGPWRVHFGS